MPAVARRALGIANRSSNYAWLMATRRYVHPEPGDTLAAIAARELSGVDDGEQQLLSWNLHLAVRAPIGPPGSVLASDIIFVEPPPKR